MNFDEERDQLLKAIGSRDEQLRELLSYCRSQADSIGMNDPLAADELNGIADKLRSILDGEQ